MILFDCEKLRGMLSGFYAYTYELGRALLAESAVRTEPLGVYIPRQCEHLLPLDGVPRRYWHHLDKHFQPLGRDVRLFHASSQLTRYTPRSWRVPVLTTVHDLNFLHMTPDCGHLEGLERRTDRAVRNATHIVTVSDFSARDIISHYGIDPSRVTRIYNGVSRYAGPLQRPAGLPDRPFLLFLGRVTETKNVHVLPALLAGNDYTLVMAGPMDKIPVERDRVLEEAHRWGVGDRIVFLGPVQAAEKHYLYRHCEAFLFPSLCEGFGLPALEALQYGKPVFLSRRTSLPEIGGDCAFYFNDEFDPEGMRKEFSDGMAAFARGELSQEAIEAHIARFDWRQAAREYYDLYERLLR